MRKSSFKIYFIVYWIALVVAIVTQTILKLFATNATTGFVDIGSFPGDIVVMYIFRLSLLLPILFWFGITIKRRGSHDYPVSYRHISSSVLSTTTGIFMLLYTFSSVGNQVINVDNIDYSKTSTLPVELPSKLLLLTVIVSGLAGGISLILSGVFPKYFVSGKPGALLGFTPALWQLLVLLARFNNFIAVTTINDVLMIILFMSFSAMFLIGQSRITFGLGVRNGKTYAIPAGLSVSLIGLSFVIPSIINYFVRGQGVYVLAINIFELLFVLSVAVYALVFVHGFARSIKIV